MFPRPPFSPPVYSYSLYEGPQDTQNLYKAFLGLWWVHLLLSFYFQKIFCTGPCHPWTCNSLTGLLLLYLSILSTVTIVIHLNEMLDLVHPQVKTFHWVPISFSPDEALHPMTCVTSLTSPHTVSRGLHFYPFINIILSLRLFSAFLFNTVLKFFPTLISYHCSYFLHIKYFLFYSLLLFLENKLHRAGILFPYFVSEISLEPRTISGL